MSTHPATDIYLFDDKTMMYSLFVEKLVWMYWQICTCSNSTDLKGKNKKIKSKIKCKMKDRTVVSKYTCEKKREKAYLPTKKNGVPNFQCTLYLLLFVKVVMKFHLEMVRL